MTGNSHVSCDPDACKKLPHTSSKYILRSHVSIVTHLSSGENNGDSQIICVASKRIETLFSYVMSQVSRIARDVKKVVELVEPKKEAFATLQKIS